jgi:hypothetical protein
MLDLKAKNSNLPAPAEYLERLAAINRLGEFKEWVLEPGMQFGEKAKWWGGGERTTPHEGIDLLNYRTANGKTAKVSPGMKVPPIFDGTVAAIIDDFLGKSIFLKHPQYQNGKMVLFTSYGHTEPEKGLSQDSAVKVNEIIGSVADGTRRRSKIANHLHISTGWMREDIEAKDLNWDSIVKSEKFVLFDPHLILTINQANSE